MDTAPPTTPPTPAAPPPPFGTRRPRELRRRPDEGHIAGVCAGVAEYFNIDPVIVRIATVVLAFSGTGLFAYLLAW
ncbi:MAG: PspC domain-containing protein, partial [Microthrixaceae bacterium]